MKRAIWLLCLVECTSEGVFKPPITDGGQTVNDGAPVGSEDLSQATPGDMSPMACAATVPQCPSGYTCDTHGFCIACATSGLACCSRFGQKQSCDSSYTCIACRPSDWGEYTRCQASDCGSANKECCWKPYDCSGTIFVEWCFTGLTCTNHRCK